MIRKIHILVEGQTEETFIRNVLAPHLFTFNVFPTAIIIKTKVVLDGSDFKGGYVSYAKIKNRLQNLLEDSSASLITTMFDYFKLAEDFPGKGTIQGKSCFERVQYLEEEWKKDMKNKRFLPYIQLHEFEALLFSSPEQVASLDSNSEVLNKVQQIKNEFSTPEEINDNIKTAPSKRLKNIFPHYEKVYHGSLLTSRIGLSIIKKECPHFRGWLEKLEKINQESD